MDEKTIKHLIEIAKKNLERNWTGKYTKPSPQLYPHQWNWDSGFISIGYSHFNLNKARQEILSLFEAQWANGMLPHIVFNPNVSGYFPGADFWNSKLSPQAPKNIYTSGLTMPAVHSTVCLIIYKNQKNNPDKDFLKFMFEKLKKLHSFFYDYRDPNKEGLVYIRHPWESGMDNSPSWDHPLERINLTKVKIPSYKRVDNTIVSPENRPTKEDYDRYVYLVAQSKKHNYDEKLIFSESVFLIQDPLFNSILCKANEDLIEIASILKEDSSQIKEWYEQTKRSINDKLWNEEERYYTCFDLYANKQIKPGSVSGLLPIYGGIPDLKRAQLIIDKLNSPSFSNNGGETYLVPTYDMQSKEFNPVKYWRGPVWININWFLYNGLRRYNFHSQAERVLQDTFDLISRYGFYEYFNPKRNLNDFSSGAYGGNHFSWSSALFIDLFSKYLN
ncbi:amylo-alpha-1,6-glucosidase [Melioribacteraceae bacterium 4301-Me]|uniref:amylo-alpha-1,6-glucosidase n=1 Tax=Pyranulibacter aquaticus TaxID=3163344 RepID=UPI00359589CC